MYRQRGVWYFRQGDGPCEVAPMQFCMFLKTLVGAEEMQRMMGPGDWCSGAARVIGLWVSAVRAFGETMQNSLDVRVLG